MSFFNITLPFPPLLIYTLLWPHRSSCLFKDSTVPHSHSSNFQFHIDYTSMPELLEPSLIFSILLFFFIITVWCSLNLWREVYLLFSVHFSHSVMSDSLQPHEQQHTGLLCPSPNPGACSNSCPLVSDSIQPSHLPLASSPHVFNLSKHQGLFQWISSVRQMAKVLELQLQHQFFQWIFRTGFL